MRTYNRVPIEERFWQYVNKTESCWLWTGAIRSNGYGVINEGGNHGKAIRVHRLSYEMHHGPIPPDLLVCHTCDVRNCVNPDHLFLGTYKDNNQDMSRKGRARGGVTGEAHGSAKLTEQQVLEIRTKYAEHQPPLRELAAEYGVVLQIIHAIVHNKIWTHVSGPIASSDKLTLGESNNMAKLTKEQVLAIRAEYAAGNTDRFALGEKYNVSHMAIWRVVKRLTWKHI